MSSSSVKDDLPLFVLSMRNMWRVSSDNRLNRTTVQHSHILLVLFLVEEDLLKNQKVGIVFVLGCTFMASQSLPLTSEEGSSLVQQQAQEDYKQHQDTLQNRESSSSTLSKPDYNANGFTYDNKDKTHRDRGYGFEKAYAYSRETAFFDFYDDKGALNARDIVEKYGNSDNKEEDLLKNISS
ncbi:UNVERIFIED_CONTAM: hypothetical protein NCL1_30484 [Trichonephila clavipes]